MSKGITFKLDDDGLSKKLGALKGIATKEGRAARHAEGELIMTDAKRRTPGDTGTQRRSGSVQSDDKVTSLSFGGAASQYAVFVHEILTNHHPVGEAKFLENAMRHWEASGGIQRLGARIGKALGG